MLEQPLVFICYSNIQFFNSLPFPTVRETIKGTLLLNMQHPCDLQDDILHYLLLTRYFSLKSYLKKHRISQSCKYPVYLPLLTYFTYLQPNKISQQVLFVLGCQNHYINLSLVFNQLLNSSMLLVACQLSSQSATIPINNCPNRSAANLSIHQNWSLRRDILKFAPSNRHFQNWSLKTTTKKTFLKLLHQNRHHDIYFYSILHQNHQKKILIPLTQLRPPFLA